jgi:hypothetical protein
MPSCPTNHSIAAAAIAVAYQEPPTMPPVVATAQAAAIEPAEAQTQPNTNVADVPLVSLLPVLSPAFASNDVIDYSTSDGMTLYSASIAILPIKDFEGTGGNVQTWINDFIERAQAMNGIVFLTVMINGISYSFQDSSLQPFNKSKIIQDPSFMLFKDTRSRTVLSSTICPKLKTKVSNCSDYIINILGHEFADRPCFHGAILQHLYIDTPSTAYFKRSQLSKMPTIMKLAEGNINNFKKERVITLVNELASVGQTVNHEDLLTNQMKGYEAAPDKPFVCQMPDRHTRIMHFNNADSEMEPIMRLAEQFWTDRTNNGNWGEPAHEEQQLR